MVYFDCLNHNLLFISIKVFLYFCLSNFEIIPLPYQARNPKTVEWLWKVSEKWTNVKENMP